MVGAAARAHRCLPTSLLPPQSHWLPAAERDCLFFPKAATAQASHLVFVSDEHGLEGIVLEAEITPPSARSSHVAPEPGCLEFRGNRTICCCLCFAG